MSGFVVAEFQKLNTIDFIGDFFGLFLELAIRTPLVIPDI